MAKGKYEYWLSPEGLLKLEGWARDGLIDEQIAKNIGINPATLYEWKKKYSKISESLKKGKEIVDIQVENALLKRALGYSYKEVTKERLIDTGQKKRHGGESKLTEREWKFAVAYFNHCCCYCGKVMKIPTKDHIKPLCKGGKLTKQNVVPCCKNCNSSKKDKELLSWYQSQKFFDKMKLDKIYDYIRFITAIEDSLSEGMGDLVITKEVEKEVIPDTTAQIFWLKNRRPDRWRDKQDIDLDKEVPIQITFKKASEKKEGELDGS